MGNVLAFAFLACLLFFWAALFLGASLWAAGFAVAAVAFFIGALVADKIEDKKYEEMENEKKRVL